MEHSKKLTYLTKKDLDFNKALEEKGVLNLLKYLPSNLESLISTVKNLFVTVIKPLKAIPNLSKKDKPTLESNSATIHKQ
jgi:hypothetical protein